MSTNVERNRRFRANKAKQNRREVRGIFLDEETIIRLDNLGGVNRSERVEGLMRTSRISVALEQLAEIQRLLREACDSTDVDRELVNEARDRVSELRGRLLT